MASLRLPNRSRGHLARLIRVSRQFGHASARPAQIEEQDRRGNSCPVRLQGQNAKPPATPRYS